MERTVPSTASEEVELYLRTYYSLLRSTADVHIRTLEEAHSGMKSLLHPAAREEKPDMAAFIYSLLRLPDCIRQVSLVVLGQSVGVFTKAGYDVEAWQQVASSARRRRCFFDGQGTLACFIASRSDIDDVIPMLTAYQIEWNKFHALLRRLPAEALAGECAGLQGCEEIFQMSTDDLGQLRTIWGEHYAENIRSIASQPCRLRVRLLSGSLSEYRRATTDWWENIERLAPELASRPVYFVSSNTHSLVNLLTGFALRKRQHLVDYIAESANESLMEEWHSIQQQHVASSQENFLYYLLKKYQSTVTGRALLEEQLAYEKSLGMLRASSEHTFDVDAQVIELSRIDGDALDPRLQSTPNLETLRGSDALLLNIDYPLGLAAYNILTEVAEQVGWVLGVYVMGKAASLNGAVGDVVIPNVVHDEHSQNTYLFANCFAAADIVPYLIYGSVLDNQKAVTVQGTFLQNAHYMEIFYREGYTDIEMEAGAYLSAVYEMHRPKRHPVNEMVNLYGLPFDLGIVHYVSDTPLSKGRNLGAGNLSYYGMDSTYAASLAVLRRIFKVEGERLQRKKSAS
ncbi:MAG: hypothetical protein JW726_11630 [Anaerolineales bacterium]|nr:hypothetical protein [Anaerolineales bacterium]